MLDSPYATDTSPEAEAVQFELVRRMTPEQRVGIAIGLTNELVRCSKAAIRRRHPECSEVEIGFKFIEMHYGTTLAEAVRQRLSDTNCE